MTVHKRDKHQQRKPIRRLGRNLVTITIVLIPVMMRIIMVIVIMVTEIAMLMHVFIFHILGKFNPGGKRVGHV